MIAQILDLDFCVTEKNCIRRFSGLVDITDPAVRRKPLYFNFQRGLVGVFPCDLSSFLRHFFADALRPVRAGAARADVPDGSNVALGHQFCEP